jgi:hypothetical protein
MAVLDADARKACATPRPVAVLKTSSTSLTALRKKRCMLGNQSMFPSVQFLPGGTRAGHKVRRSRCNRIPAGDPRRCAAPASSRAFREGRAPEMGPAPACPWQVRCIMGDFLVDFWTRVRPVARRLSVPGAMMSYPRLNCAIPPSSYKNQVSRNAALWASACRDTSKGGRVNATLPFQNDGERLLHGVYFVRLTFHFDEYVLFIAPAARGTAAANHDPTV